MLRDWYEPPAVTEAFAQYKQKELRLEGQLGMQKGKRAEQRALSALTHSLPHWAQTARLATHEEDGRGIDIVIETLRLGDLYVQIKSSRNGARQYRRRRRRAKAIVVVIGEDMEERKIREKMLSAIHRLRRYYLSIRRKKNPGG